jgi:hypothetical protein
MYKYGVTSSGMTFRPSFIRIRYLVKKLLEGDKDTDAFSLLFVNTEGRLLKGSVCLVMQIDSYVSGHYSTSILYCVE